VTEQAGRHEATDPEGQQASLDYARLILDSAHEAFISMDANGVIVEWNREAERTFGYSREEALGRDLASTIIPERFRTSHGTGVQRFLHSGEARLLGRRLELAALHREGHEFPIELTVSGTASGPPASDQLRFHAFLHDISARKLSEQVLMAMQSVTQAMSRAESPRLAMESLLATLGEDMHWDVGTYWSRCQDGKLRRSAGWHASNVRAGDFTGRGGEIEFGAGEGFPGRTLARREPLWVQDFIAEEDFPRREAAARAGLHAAIGVPVVRSGDVVGVIEFLASDLRVQDSSLTEALTNVGEQVGELLGILEDRQALLSRLEHLALTDQLTGLPNRRAWEEGLRRELARASRDRHPVSVAVIDLDYFKRYNDQRGHLAGDALLREAADRWLGQLRAGDLLARYGGEEFAAVIPAWPPETVVMVVERLRNATPSDQTCSAGVAFWDGSERADELFARADAALYEAKQAGRNQTVASS
jgi:diguanylate cyclase (GGDEF)-like protein/PAS domain S-box-containing protein